MVWYLVIMMWKTGTVVVPAPYSSEAKCHEAFAKIATNYNKVADPSYLCVPGELKK